VYHLLHACYLYNAGRMKLSVSECFFHYFLKVFCKLCKFRRQHSFPLTFLHIRFCLLIAVNGKGKGTRNCVPLFRKSVLCRKTKALLSQPSTNHNLIQATRGLLKGCDVTVCAATVRGGGRKSGTAGAESILCRSLTANVTKKRFNVVSVVSDPPGEPVIMLPTQISIRHARGA